MSQSTAAEVVHLASRAGRYRDGLARAEWHRLRGIAQYIRCIYCNADAGYPCISSTTGEQLVFQPAHGVRLVDSGAMETAP